MTRAGLVLALLVWVGLLAAPVVAQQRTAQANPRVRVTNCLPVSMSGQSPTLAGNMRCIFWESCGPCGTLVVILNLRVAPRLRNWAQHASRRRYVQAALFVPRPDAGREFSPSSARDVRALAGPALRSIRPGMDLLVVGLDQGRVARIRDRDRAGLDPVWGHTAQPAALVAAFLARLSAPFGVPAFHPAAGY